MSERLENALDIGDLFAKTKNFTDQIDKIEAKDTPKDLAQL